jgi:hypothetical protein
VVERPLSAEERRALVELVERKADTTGGIDLGVVTRAEAEAPERTPSVELYIGIHGGRREFLEHAPEPDLLIELAIVRALGRSLSGPEPAAVIGPVPDEWVLAHGDDVLARWEGLTDDAENADLMVLTACRIWHFAVEGRHRSKRQAALWVLAQGPNDAVAAALRRRYSGEEAVIEPDEIAEVLARARREVARRLSR